MRDGPRGFTPDSSCPALLRWPPRRAPAFRLRGSHPLRPAFPRRSATLVRRYFGGSYYPGGRVATPPVWASSAFARRYSRNHCCFLFLRVLRCFSSPRWPRLRRCPRGRVSPFGHPRIDSHLPIPAAFRSLSRPSSPPGALGIPHAPSFAFLFTFFCLRCRDLRPGALSLLGLLLTLACTPCQ